MLWSLPYTNTVVGLICTHICGFDDHKRSATHPPGILACGWGVKVDSGGNPPALEEALVSSISAAPYQYLVEGLTVSCSIQLSILFLSKTT